MPKLICTSRYIKNSQSKNAGNLVRYMGTREGVEKLSDGYDKKPATKKTAQFDLRIAESISSRMELSRI